MDYFFVTEEPSDKGISLADIACPSFSGSFVAVSKLESSYIVQSLYLKRKIVSLKAATLDLQYLNMHILVYNKHF